VAREDTQRKVVSTGRLGGKNTEALTSQGCVASTSEDEDILVNKLVISSNDGIRYNLALHSTWNQVQLGTSLHIGIDFTLMNLS